MQQQRAHITHVKVLVALTQRPGVQALAVMHCSALQRASGADLELMHSVPEPLAFTSLARSVEPRRLPGSTFRQPSFVQHILRERGF